MAEVERQYDLHPGPDGWVSERWLVSEAPDWPELRAVELMSAPGLWRGRMEAHSDCHGHVRYRPPAEGRAALADADPEDDPLTSDPDPEAAAYYDDHYFAARDRLRNAPPDDPREIGPVPLPASMPGGPEPVEAE